MLRGRFDVYIKMSDRFIETWSYEAFFSLYWYASINLDDQFVIFGGTHDGTIALNGIFGYNDNGWTKIGVLNEARYQHSAISNGEEIMIVGGLTAETLGTEIWNVNFTHSRTISPNLNGFDFYPELFLVSYDFPSNSENSTLGGDVKNCSVMNNWPAKLHVIYLAWIACLCI